VKSFGLALGGGGARGIAHVAVLEAIDELGVKPVAIAGTSIGAWIGAAYAAGMSGKEIRRYLVALAHDRGDMLRRVFSARAGTFASIVGSGLGFGSTTLVDGEKLCQQFLPSEVPEDFSGLGLPLTVMTSDLYRREQLAFSSGPLRPALAASIALPSLIRPVVIDDRVLIDGGATNPLPFDQLQGRADVVVAVDVSGETSEEKRGIPSPWECLVTTVLVMGNAITTEKLKHRPPELMIRPKVGVFRTLDFLQASAILRAAEHAKGEIEARLLALLGD
jgi:NTE family protein